MFTPLYLVISFVCFGFDTMDLVLVGCSEHITSKWFILLQRRHCRFTAWHVLDRLMWSVPQLGHLSLYRSSCENMFVADRFSLNEDLVGEAFGNVSANVLVFSIVYANNRLSSFLVSSCLTWLSAKVVTNASLCISSSRSPNPQFLDASRTRTACFSIDSLCCWLIQ